MNQNTEYEKLVAQIHQGMLEYEGYENLRVEHDVTLTGKSGATHQIDVFWEFKAAGTTYRTCIECKNYKSAVKKLHVAAFAETLRDIGNANGIIATTSSFQKGAKLLAKQNNIRLVLVNYLLKEVHITSNPILTNFSNLDIEFTRDSMREALIRNNLVQCTISWNVSGEDPLKDDEGNKIETLNTLLNKHPKKEGANVIENVNLYLDVDKMGMVKIDSIKVDVTYTRLPPMKSIVSSPNSAKSVIEDIVDENIHYLHDDGSVSEDINA